MNIANSYIANSYISSQPDLLIFDKKIERKSLPKDIYKYITSTTVRKQIIYQFVLIMS